jgi:hypothetical protein
MWWTTLWYKPGRGSSEGMPSAVSRLDLLHFISRRHSQLILIHQILSLKRTAIQITRCYSNSQAGGSPTRQSK